MEVKLFEVRDRGTMIPWIAIKMDGSTMSRPQRWLMESAGYGSEFPCIIQGHAHFPGTWTYRYEEIENPRTMQAAPFIAEHFDKLMGGEVVDVRVLLGESKKAAKPEAPR